VNYWSENEQHSAPVDYYTLNSDASWLNIILNKELTNNMRLPRDYYLPSDSNNPGGFDKRTLAIDLHDWQSRHLVPTSAVNAVLDVFQKHFKGGNFPIVDKNPLLETCRTSTVRNNIDNYVGSDALTEVIDVCKNDCIAFHGVQSIRGQLVDCSQLLSCPVCEMQRFSHCTHVNCRDADYESCSPFPDPVTNICKGHRNRVPMKTAYYRAITGKLLLLFKQSLTSGNANLLKYMDDNANGDSKYRVTREGCIIDTCDGSLVREHNAAMEMRFLEVKAQYEREHPGDTLSKCSILFTLFYDGVVLFERDSDSIWPMLCSVLNCDPSKRSKLGVGLFLNMLHNISMGSGAEQYLVDSILTSELVQLEKGMIFHFDHPENPSVKIAVFLQARCVFAHLDTIALQKFAKIQGANSGFGCKCGTIKGCHRQCLHKRVYLGERAKLHQEHFLRQFTCKSHRFCTLMEETDFYNGGKDSQDTIQRLYDVASLKPKYDLVTDGPLEMGYSFNNKSILQAHARYCATDSPTFCWYNYMFPLSMFEKSLSYALRDRRVQLIFADCNMSNELYLEYGAIAENNRAAWEQSYWFTDRVRPKQTPSHAHNGVTGICSLLRDTTTLKITNLTYDVMHIVENLGGYINDLITGHRGMDDNIRKLCTAQGIFPFMRYKNMLPPWRVTHNCMLIIDSICNCLLLPVGYKSAFGIRFPCQRNGQQRAKEHMFMIMSLNYYLYSFTKMKSAYRNYFARLASDLCRLLNPCLHVTELDNLILSVYETRALCEGLFPESEANFVHHEIVDVVNHIEVLGAARGIQNFNGERSLSTITSLVAKGGVHPLKGVESKYMALENIYSRDLCVPFQYAANDGKYSDFVLKMYGKKYPLKLSMHELDSLLSSIINVIETSEMDRPAEKSAVYRLFVAYKRCKSLITSKPSFGEWILHLHNHFQTVRGAPLAVLYAHFRGYLMQICSDRDIHSTAAAQLATDGIILFSDFDGIVREIATFEPVARTQVIIKGVNFRCRGVQFREGQRSPAQHVFTNPLNNLMVNWYKDDDSSSWACVNRYYVLPARNIVSKATEMVQLNLVYRLNLESDRFLHGLAFADACVRKTSFDSTRRKFFTCPNTSFNGSRQYVCLNNVCSSAIGLSVLNEDDLPIVHQNRFHSVSWTKERDHLTLAPKNSVVSKIYFVELHPERISYMYGLIEEDLDHTKYWELD